MNTSLATFAAIVIAALVGADAVFFDWQYSLALARRFTDLLTWLAFWR